MAMTYKGGNAAPKKPLTWLSDWTTWFLAWLAGPLVLLGFWWRSHPAHNEWLTLLIAACLAIAIYTGWSSWWNLRASLGYAAELTWVGREDGLGRWVHPIGTRAVKLANWIRAPRGKTRWGRPYRKLLGRTGIFVLISISWLRTEGGIGHHANRSIDIAEKLWIEEGRAFEIYENVNLIGEGDDRVVCREREKTPPCDQWKVENIEDPQIVQEFMVAQHWFTRDRFRFPKKREASESWQITQWILQIRPDWVGRNFLAASTMSGVEFMVAPEDWRSKDIHYRRFRAEFCKREGLEAAECHYIQDMSDKILEDGVGATNKWCASSASKVPCRERFNDINSRFDIEWKEERDTLFSQLGGSIDLRGQDLRYASLSASFMPGANLVRARMDGADLRLAQLERADLRRAYLRGAILRRMRLEDAKLRFARLDRADLRLARMEGADLRGAFLMNTTLRQVRLDGANLLRARLKDADLQQARLDGADLRLATFQSANLIGATLGSSLAHGADFKGVKGLKQEQLDQVIGNSDTLLPDGVDDLTQEPFFVWSCWESEPSGFEALIKRAADQRIFGSEVKLRNQFLCGDTPRVKTGTPTPLDEP